MRSQGEITSANRLDTKTFMIRLTSVAVLATILLSLGWLFFKPSGVVEPGQPVVADQADFESDKALLAIGDGDKINLTDAKPGVVYEEAGVQVVKISQKQIEYRLSQDTKVASAAHPIHTITTPKGQQFQVTLSDGTKVWMNAASSVNFPMSFVALDSRRLSLTGEAYFEVAQNKAQPFFLSAKQQEIQVLGTHFNVSAYDNESSIRTTLLEGSLRVTSKLANKFVVLKPGEQATMTSTGLTVSPTDAEESAAWKNGEYVFRNTPLEDVMHVVERQYNIKVVYKNEAKKTLLIGGTILLSSNLTDVLSLLEVTSSADLKLEGTRVTVL